VKNVHIFVYFHIGFLYSQVTKSSQFTLNAKNENGRKQKKKEKENKKEKEITNLLKLYLIVFCLFVRELNLCENKTCSLKGLLKFIHLYYSLIRLFIYLFIHLFNLLFGMRSTPKVIPLRNVCCYQGNFHPLLKQSWSKIEVKTLKLN